MVLIYTLILIAMALTVAGEVLLKLGISQVGEFSFTPAVLLRTFTEWRVVLGFALIFAGSLFWLGVISRANLSFAYPLLALNYLLIMLPSYYLLGERISLNQIVGAAIIVVGVVVITRQ
ncbi:MAG: EamA family transporter [Chloroflexales bacterium]|nr:EamA family transporter [Chloroflexales bacterium]